MTDFLISADISISLLEISTLRFIKKCWYRLLLTLLQSSKIFLKNMVAILMISAKMAALCLPQIKIFWNKDYNVKTFVNDITNKLLSREFQKDLTGKPTFFEGYTSLKLNNSGLALGMVLKFYSSVTKALKLKVRKFWGLILTFVEVSGEKQPRGSFCFPPPPSWIGLKISLTAHLSIFQKASGVFCCGFF